MSKENKLIGVTELVEGPVKIYLHENENEIPVISKQNSQNSKNSSKKSLDKIDNYELDKNIEKGNIDIEQKEKLDSLK